MTNRRASEGLERGYDSLTLDQLRRHLETDVVGHHLYLFDSVESTNSTLANLADRGATEGTVVLSEKQTGGRGRHGSNWFSPTGAGLYASVLFHPPIAPRDLPLFAPIASLALAEAVWLEGAPAQIKWPNDVVVGGRKLGGALVYAPVIAGRLAYVILGIGVNLTIPPAELAAGLGTLAEDAVSLHEVVDHEVDRNVFAATLLNRLEKWHHTFLTRGPAAVHAAWRARDYLAGRRVQTRTNDEIVEGWARGIAADGSLTVEDSLGTMHHVVAGPVRVIESRPADSD